jgi:phospholipid-binding lipoprotein MlaA
MNKALIIAIALVSIGLTGCASNSAKEQAQAQTESNTDPKDPLEPVNRVIWDLNYEILDEYLLRPVTVGYVTVMPQFARTGLLNAAQNLSEPVNVVNNLLQGKVPESIDSLFRFLINSTIGLAGTIDVAGKMGVAREEEGFDEVLGVYGVGNGPYLMLPAAGPTDVRGVTGRVVDNVYFPLNYINSNFTALRWAVEILEARAAIMDQEQLLENSVDPYIFVKDAYFQNKAFQVLDGNIPDEELDEDDLEDFEAFEDMLEDID